MKMRDSETGQTMWIDTSSQKVRQEYNRAWYDRQQRLTQITVKSGVDIASISTDEDFVKALLALFKRRG